MGCEKWFFFRDFARVEELKAHQAGIVQNEVEMDQLFE